MKFIKWIKHRLAHKLEHLKWSNLKKVLKAHGTALVVIIVLWEIIEDVLFSSAVCSSRSLRSPVILCRDTSGLGLLPPLADGPANVAMVDKVQKK